MREVLVWRCRDAEISETNNVPEGPTEEWEYYGQGAEITDAEMHHLTGKPKVERRAGGGWSLFGYDRYGNVSVIFEPWESTPFPAEVPEFVTDESELNCLRVKRTDIFHEISTGTYSETRETLLLEDGAPEPKKIRYEVSNRSAPSEGGSLSYSGNAATYTQTIMGTWSGAPVGNESDAALKALAETNSSGGNAFSQFTPGSSSSAHRMVISTSGADSGGINYQFGEEEDLLYGFAVPARSTQQIEIYDNAGLLLRETRILPGDASGTVEASDFETATRTAFIQDANGRSKYTYQDGRLIASYSYPSKFVTESFDEAGVKTVTVVDIRGRVVSVTTPGAPGMPDIVQTTEHDGLETRRFVNGRLMFEGINDAAGRTVKTIDEIGAETNYRPFAKINCRYPGQKACTSV